MAAQDDILDEVESKANDTDDDDIMLDAKEHLTEDGKHNYGWQREFPPGNCYIFPGNFPEFF